MIGQHLIIDGETKEYVSKETVKRILRKLPSKIDMNILEGPHIVEGCPDNPGFTGFIIIDKSHISIHTFNNVNTISVDVFSCKPFNTKKVITFFKKMINFTRITTRIINREIIP
jgi:S-adenosylmethionine decarboxylase